ncbi:MAG TPA: peroxiredoxin [Thermoanaerobaculia bacterium]|nr:peroxiredoxin [Thermoanaerobaculia bacterium]HUM29638.1 peroxiredoxin [Thermoanaerobaculia bacterium]HXK67289.1 peroxiredoxin [Thermoanaerobaculia bacterium]
MNTSVRVGQRVPEFSMNTYVPTEGDFGKFSLSSQLEKGRWTILMFYPADFTFVCATEFAALAAKHEEFDRLGADVLSVSTDTEFTHLAWRTHERMLQDVHYAMAADPTGNVSRLFGVYDESSGLALRGTFIISPDGILINAEINFYNLGRNMDELMRKFKASLHLSRHPEQACPAQWREEGDKTLTPSPKLVGKVYESLA